MFVPATKILRKTGEYLGTTPSASFIPCRLPPDPSLENTPALLEAYGKAMLEIGKLNEVVSQRLPEIRRFVHAYVMKEALLSSEIEGIHTTLLDIFTAKITRQGIRKETLLVTNYLEALEVAMAAMRNEGLPLVERILRRAHAALLQGELQAHPGEYRNLPMRVGSFYPPPANQVPPLMAQLEQYMNSPQDLPLIRAGLAHVQFEMIHPFLDGNGRIGRLLIVLLLLQERVLHQPLLYPSLFFKKHHVEYYARLDKVRTEGDFEGWILFYLQAIVYSAKDASERAYNIFALEQRLLRQITDSELFPRSQLEAKELLTFLFRTPILGIKEAAVHLHKSFNATQALLQKLIQLEIIQPLSAQKRNRRFVFHQYLQALESSLPA